MQSKKLIHTAIIMDGNGRWAQKRGLDRSRGHDAGVAAVHDIVAAAPALGIKMLTLFAISSDNLNRPAAEVSHLFHLVRQYLRAEGRLLAAQDIRLIVIGRRDRLPKGLAAEIAGVELATAHCRALTVRIAVDYSSRDALLHAIKAAHPATRDELSSALSGLDAPADVDLLIRTSGEQRLSDFLLWECAYAELVFCPQDWPEFTRDDLHQAVQQFQRRQRRFGRVSPNPKLAPTGQETAVSSCGFSG